MIGIDDLPDHRPVSFTPAPAGWCAVVVGPEWSGTVPLVGWAIVEEVNTDRHGEVATELGGDWRARQIRPMVIAGEDGLQDLEDYYGDEVWLILEPGAAGPDPEAIAKRREHVRAIRQARRDLGAAA